MAGGYLAYAMVHHATHHATRRLARQAGISRWLTGRRRWHALHHSQRQTPGHFGVTTGFWDRVFGTTQVSRAPSTPTTPTQGS
jgi:cyclopropane-fatty-acyl-phospholipid synthase